MSELKKCLTSMTNAGSFDRCTSSCIFPCIWLCRLPWKPLLATVTLTCGSLWGLSILSWSGCETLWQTGLLKLARNGQSSSASTTVERKLLINTHKLAYPHWLACSDRMPRIWQKTATRLLQDNKRKHCIKIC